MNGATRRSRSVIGRMVTSVRAPADNPEVAVAEAFEPDRDRLRLPPIKAAQVFVTLHLASTRHAAITPEEPPLRPEQIISLLLDGLLKRPPETPVTEES